MLATVMEKLSACLTRIVGRVVWGCESVGTLADARMPIMSGGSNHRGKRV